jgi:hypothetical protein
MRNLSGVSSQIYQGHSLQKISDISFSNLDMEIVPFLITTTPQLLIFNHQDISIFGNSMW